MPTNTLDKIRHSLSCVAVLFGLLGILFLPHFRLPMPGFIWEVWLRLLYIVLFLSMRLPRSIYSKYYPFLSLGRLSFVECFFPALAPCALPFSTML